MPSIRRVITGFRALFRKSRADEELDAELREYLRAAVAEKRRAGLSQLQAVRAARAEMGSIEAVKDRVRDVGWESTLESIWQDVRYGARMLRRSPGFTVLVVVLLAPGIGANTAVFSVINTLMLRDLPVKQPERLVELLWQYPGDPRRNFFGWKVYEHFRDHNHVFSDVIGDRPARFQLTRDGEEVERVDGEYVVGSFFPALGVQAAVGRLIAPEDDRVASVDAAVAVLSWSYWNEHFKQDPSVPGTRIVLSGVQATVIGVAPRGFFGLQVGTSPDVWVPAAMATLVPGPNRTARDQLGLRLMGRLGRLVRCTMLRNACAGSNENRRTREDVPRPAVASRDNPGGVRGRRVLAAARRLCAVTARPDGDRRAAPADCLHEYRRVASGARRVAPARDGSACRARRRSRPRGAPGIDRVAAVVGHGQCPRNRAGLFRRRGAGTGMAYRHQDPGSLFGEHFGPA